MSPITVAEFRELQIRLIVIITLIDWRKIKGVRFCLHFPREVYIAFAISDRKFLPSRSIGRVVDNSKIISKDSLFGGDLICFQHTAGYRFSIDAVLIAHFAQVRRDNRILDLGTGCGIIMLILLFRWGNLVKEMVGIEIQPGLAELAAKNMAANCLGEKGRILTGDLKNIRDLIPPESFDSVVCNPPFFPCGSGRESDNMEARLARHQCLATLEDFLHSASLAVQNGGSVYCIYPAERLTDVVRLAEKYRLSAKRLQFVYSYPQDGHDARLVLLHCRKNGGTGTKVLPPFYVYCEKDGAFSPEMQRCYDKNLSL